MTPWPLDEIRSHVESYMREYEKYGVAVIDIDFFIRFCKKFDKNEIEDIISNITLFFKSHFPKEAVIWKSDGDEYLILIPGFDRSKLQDALTAVKRNFRKHRFAQNSSKEYSNVAMTFSAGVAAFPDDGDEPEKIIKRAVVALFLAKAFRRNQVVAACDENKEGFPRVLLDKNLKVHIAFGRYGETGFIKDVETSAEALMWEPQAIDTDDEGNLYIADQNNHAILRYDGRFVTRVAGTGSYGYSGDGGPAKEASLNKPTGLVVYKNYIYITDTGNDVVRVVDMKSGRMATVAGNGEAGYSGDGGPAASACLNKPGGAVVDKAGNLYINDIANNVIRKVDTQGIISTYAGTGEYGYTGDGGSMKDATFAEIYGMGIDKRNGDLYLADYLNHCIRRIDAASGTITTVAGTGTAGFYGDGNDSRQAGLSRPVAVLVDDAGNLYIAESGNSCIRFVCAETKKIYTLMGDGVCGTGDAGAIGDFRLSNPNGIAKGVDNKLFVLDGANNRVCYTILNIFGGVRYEL